MYTILYTHRKSYQVIPKKLLAENLHTGILHHDVQCDLNIKKEEEGEETG